MESMEDIKIINILILDLVCSFCAVQFRHICGWQVDQ